MKKHIFSIPVLILVTFLAVLLIGIFYPKNKPEEVKEGDIQLYYMSADNYSFVTKPYTFVNKSNALEKAKEALNQLKKIPEDVSCLPIIPQEIVWSDINLESTNLVIDFTAEYQKMESTKEIFLRAGIVKTLVQIGTIRTVEFKVTGTPLMALNNQPVGMMDGDDFIDGTEENWGVNQEEKIHLYFADQSGMKLEEKEVELTVVNNIPMEQLIIEALIQTDKFQSPVPAGTKVLKTITKDQICYVDLSREFLNPMEKVSGDVTIYAIVNSLVERAGVNKVLFTVEGSVIEGFRTTVDLSQPVSRNLDLVQ